MDGTRTGRVQEAMRYYGFSMLWAMLLAGTAAVAPVRAEDATPTDRAERVGGNVTTAEVKRFLDPTLMESRVSYGFQANWLTADVEVVTHRFHPWFALSNSHAVWLDVPYSRIALPTPGGASGLGDLNAGWGFILHEDRSRRLTTVAGGIEGRLPTGDADKGLGLDQTIASAGLAVVTNPTDLFPVNLTVWYRHTVDAPEGSPDVRALDLRLQTFHILPRGFFLAVLPSYAVDLTGDRDVFSLGLGLGRAFSRRISLQVGYLEHVAGAKTFNRAFTLGATWLWGPNLGAS